MEKAEALRIAASDAKVSDKIRALDAAGFPRAEIARLLDKRYQHVRNVLEGDKLARREAAPSEPPFPGQGMSEGASTFIHQGVVRLKVGLDGTVKLPPQVLEALGTPAGGVLIADFEDDRLVVLSHGAVWARIQALAEPYRPKDGRLISEELIAERRAAAARGE